MLYTQWKRIFNPIRGW